MAGQSFEDSAATAPPRAEVPSPFQETRYGWLVLGVVWLACAVYMGASLRDGWIPYDAGSLSQMAERVLRGQVPFRDFGEVYSGGLTYLNALAFRLFGMNFFSLRIPLFLFFLSWIPSVYFLARRFVRPLAAGALTLLAVAWSVPNYPEAMPSWYNLFFATWGVLALLRYAEREERRWLLIAGTCGGLSLLVKVSGLYFVAAGLLFLIFREQSLSRAEPEGLHQRALAYRLFVTLGLSLFLVLLVSLISQRPTAGEYFQFVLPLGCLVAFLLWGAWAQPSAQDSAARFRRLSAMILPFLGGMLLPVAAFLAWFTSQGALTAWITGVFVRPGMRIHWAAYNAISPVALVGLLPAALAVFLAVDGNRSVRLIGRYAVPVALAALLFAAWRWLAVYSFIGFSLPLLVPTVALAALLQLRRRAAMSEANRQRTFLLVVTAVACALIQFPYSVAIYFEFVAPLLILAVIALFPRRRRSEPVAVGALLAFCLVFAVWLHTPGFYIGVGVPTRQPFHLQMVTLARAGGIRARARLASEYERLIPLIRSHARGRYIYATPDVPQVYFLSGLRNPTGDLFDLLDPDFPYPSVRARHTLAALREHGVSVVVLGPKDPAISGPIPPGLRALLDAGYPESTRVGEFEVRWKP